MRRGDIQDFLRQRHVALVGVSRDGASFADSVARMLEDRGVTVYPVTASRRRLLGESPAYASVRDVPDPLGGVIVMVDPAAALGVVDDCVARGVGRIWFDRGLGPGSWSKGADITCRAHGITVVDGMCPLVFAEPVGWLHRLQRVGRRRNVAV